MKIVFFGSSEFSMKPLEAIHRSTHKLIGVVTVPAAPKGRGQKQEETKVSRWAKSKMLKVWSPEKLRDASFQDSVRVEEPDLFVVASYGKILPDAVLAIPKRFALNIHPSLLPKYRGAAPLNWQIINGEGECGVTFFRMTAGMDAGDIVWQKAFPLGEDENTDTLGNRLSEESSKALPEILTQIENGRTKFVPQNASEATIAPKLEKSDGEIRWNESASAIHNRIRGLYPWPCAHSLFRGISIKIIEALPFLKIQANAVPGTIMGVDAAKGLEVATGSGAIFIRKLQKPGKRVVSGQEFANGERLKPSEKFVNPSEGELKK